MKPAVNDVRQDTRPQAFLFFRQRLRLQPMEKRSTHSGKGTKLANGLNHNEANLGSHGDSFPYGGQVELADDELVLAIIDGKVRYRELQKRMPNRTEAARFYASVASASFACPSKSESDCEFCGLPGSDLTLDWTATFLRRGDLFAKSLVLFPLVLLTVVLGGIIPQIAAKADHIDFQTHHTLCRHCKPRLGRRMAAVLLRGGVCLMSLLALGVLMFTGTVLICWMAGAWGVDGAIAAGAFPWFLLSAVIMLSHLTPWWRRMEKVVALPPGLRRFANGPFELAESGSSFRVKRQPA